MVYWHFFNVFDQEDDRTLLTNSDRIRIETSFVPQKWILQHPSTKIFLSHGGISIYFGKPILGVPFNMEQFSNVISVAHSNLGASLFNPPSSWPSLINPYDFIHYTFTSNEVTEMKYENTV